jgi:hypothetical protein
MNYLTQKDFFYKCKTLKYWKGQESRWNYLSSVVNMAKEITPESILELGSMGVSIADVSHTMDIVPIPGINYLFNATETPWPISDKVYDIFIALQVFEHLDDKRILQRKVFDEAARVAKNIIISVPFMWKKTRLKNHIGINDKTVLCWASGKEPDAEKIFPDMRWPRKVYVWRNL